MLSLEDLSSILVNNIAKLVDQIAVRVNSPALVVYKVALLIGQWLDVAVGILVKLTNNIADIEATAIVVE